MSKLTLWISACVLWLAANVALAVTDLPRPWRDPKGNVIVFGKFVAEENGIVRVEDDIGQIHTLPLDDLSTADLYHVVLRMGSVESRVLVVPALTQQRRWNDASGRMIVASLVRIDVRDLVLRRADQKEFVLSFADLSPQDRRWIASIDPEFSRRRDLSTAIQRVLDQQAKAVLPFNARGQKAIKPIARANKTDPPEPHEVLERLLVVCGEKVGTEDPNDTSSHAKYAKSINGLLTAIVARHRDELVVEVIREGFPDLSAGDAKAVAMVVTTIRGKPTPATFDRAQIEKALKEHHAKLVERTEVVELLDDLRQQLPPSASS